MTTTGWTAESGKDVYVRIINNDAQMQQLQVNVVKAELVTSTSGEEEYHLDLNGHIAKVKVTS